MAEQIQGSPFKSGFIAIVGRPNVGKSTLLNGIIGEKISIVSQKPQTTRNIVRGVANFSDAQIIFIDTPGIHKGNGLLNKFMLREAMSSLDNADAVLYLIEAGNPINEDDILIIENFKRLKNPVILAINKVDAVNKQDILPLIQTCSGLFPFKEIIPISALKKDGVEILLKLIKGILPEGPKYFPEDIMTDQPERFIAAEMIREKIFLFTKDEIPYSAAVVVESFKEKKNLISISATIHVERDSQKGIIIGKGGAMLKRIGTAARQDIERLLGTKVFLELFVRVEKDWGKRPDVMKGFGY